MAALLGLVLAHRYTMKWAGVGVGHFYHRIILAAQSSGSDGHKEGLPRLISDNTRFLDGRAMDLFRYTNQLLLCGQLGLAN